ncbi:MAG TPA: GNAT family N-acetyltransferase [Spirochaetia bacterium]|nr:GNAT family N-acetyltransferase [Spirochaetia bacterium]
MNPSLRLTRELVDQIVFGMENQDRVYVLDTEEATVIPAEQIPEGESAERYLSLPEWRSVDGYNLMEQFVATLHNPIFRGRLRAILASGRGVFRQFKDTVRERREIERLWFNFKERAMRDLVSDWYNDLREREGLERLESMVAETETDQLVESDFAFREVRPADLELIRSLDREAFDEVFSDTEAGVVDAFYAQFRGPTSDPNAQESTVIVAETQGGDFAGFLWSVRRPAGEVAVAFVQQIYVLPEFRGFGLAREVFNAFCHQMHEQRVAEIVLPLYGTTLDLEPNFANYGLRRAGVLMRLDVDHWHRAEVG